MIEKKNGMSREIILECLAKFATDCGNAFPSLAEACIMVLREIKDIEMTNFSGCYGMFDRLYIGDGIAVSVEDKKEVKIYFFDTLDKVTEETWFNVYEAMGSSLTYKEWKEGENEMGVDYMWNYSDTIRKTITIEPYKIKSESFYKG